MHIVLINQFFPPSRAPTGILLCDEARVLREAGHAVTVMTSSGGYGGGAAGESADLAGLEVRRMGPGRAHGATLRSKFMDYVRFHASVSSSLASLQPRPDRVVCMTTPPLVGLAARRYGRKRGVPYWLWCMDLYPEALSAGGIMGSRHPLYRLLERWARREREDARAVISLGADMTERILRLAPAARVVEIPVWNRRRATPDGEARARAIRRMRGWRDDEVILLYSGHIGRAHRVEEWVSLAETLHALDAPARMIFSGTGPLEKEWRRRLGDRAAWCEPVPDGEAEAHLLAGDVHLVSQQTGWTGVVVPSKYQAACALGRPVLFAGERGSAVAQWIRQADTGWVLEPGCVGQDLPALVRDLCDAARRRRKGEHAREQSANDFNVDSLTRRLRLWIEDDASPGR